MSEQNILAVDTSSRLLSIAISAGKDVKFEANLEGTPRHSERLIDLIQEGLRHVGIKKSELSCFLWGMGPGSFTGLRIGLSILKGFCVGLRKRAFGASSLDLIALQASLPSGELAVCVDARREHIYVSIYRFKDGKIHHKTPDSVLSFKRLVQTIKPGMVLTGDALESYGASIRQAFGKCVSFLTSSFWYPRASGLIELWKEKPSWLVPLKLKTIKPRYLRSSEAEERFQLLRK